MGTERTPLDFGDIVDDASLDDFQPKTKKTKAPKPANDRKSVGTYPSREARASVETESWSQLNLRVQTALEQRFKRLAKARGLKHYALLQQALDAFEEQAD